MQFIHHYIYVLKSYLRALSNGTIKLGKFLYLRPTDPSQVAAKGLNCGLMAGHAATKFDQRWWHGPLAWCKIWHWRRQGLGHSTTFKFSVNTIAFNALNHVLDLASMEWTSPRESCTVLGLERGVTSTVGHFNLVIGGHLKLLNPIEGRQDYPPFQAQYI